jgi:hypothetical protein
MNSILPFCRRAGRLMKTLVWGTAGLLAATGVSLQAAPSSSPDSPASGLAGTENRHSQPLGLATCGTHPAHISSLRPAGIAPAGGPLPPADTLEEPTEIDVLFLYTPQALNGEGKEEGILRFANSAINVRLNIVYIGQIAYAERATDVLSLVPLRANRLRGEGNRCPVPGSPLESFRRSGQAPV